MGNPSSYVVTGVPLTDIQADGETVRSGFRRPTRLSRPANGQLGFELRHYPQKPVLERGRFRCYLMGSILSRSARRYRAW